MSGWDNMELVTEAVKKHKEFINSIKDSNDAPRLIRQEQAKLEPECKTIERNASLIATIDDLTSYSKDKGIYRRIIFIAGANHFRNDPAIRKYLDVPSCIVLEPREEAVKALNDSNNVLSSECNQQ